MSKFVINGGNRLYGEINISASKNAFLPIIAGSILTDECVYLNHYPYFTDTDNMCEIIKHLGGKVLFSDDVLKIDNSNLINYDIPIDLAGRVRSSIFALGAIIGRFKKAKVAYPGGCEIGARPIDIHLNGLKRLGVNIVEKHGYIYCDGSNMRGNTIVLDFPSVGATENLIMAGVLTKGETILENCAKEPEIVDLQCFLNKLGAKVKGAGSNTIVINGVERLHGCVHTPIADRIIAGTYIIACAMCGGKICLKGVDYNNLKTVIAKMDKYACKFKLDCDNIIVSSEQTPISLNRIETAVFPGIPTDLQAQLLALQCVSKGSCLIVENLFESRYKHVPELIKMGADIQLKDRVALVKGVSKLYGAEVFGCDLRGTSSLILAGLVAEGYTIVNNADYIDRGYYKIENSLSMLGGDIKRIEE